MRKIIQILLIATLLLPLAGCYDSVDLSDQIFAINLALDTGENKALRLTMQYPQITPVGKESEGASGNSSELQKDGYLIEQVEGDNLSSCLMLMRMVTPRQISMMQLRGLFVSETLANSRNFFYECLSALTATHKARPTATVFVTRGRAEDVLSEQVPLFGARLSKSQSAQSKELQRQGVIPAAPLNLFYHYLTDPSHSAVAVLSAVNGMQYISSPSNQGLQAASYLAGDLPRNTVGTVDYCGCAVFGQESLLLLDGYETQLYNLLTGNLRSLDLTVDDRTVSIAVTRSPDISVQLPENEPPRILIRLSVRCDQPDASRYTELLLQDVATLLVKLQQHGMDPIGFTDRARVHALTFAGWEAMNWPMLYSQACFEVSVR